MTRFHVYEIPIPDEFRNTAGSRSIQVSLAFDPPTRHARMDYLGTKMSFRLLRGALLNQVVDHFKKRGADEGPVPEMASRYNCDLKPGPTIRDRGTLQRGIFAMARNPSDEYGQTYYLVVRCERKWATEEDGKQRFAVVVEMQHDNEKKLYERIRARLRVRVTT
jgi:hypothetical protein